MAANPVQLTLEVQEKICSLIALGTYPHVAAEATGVPRERFEGWLAAGRRPGARSNVRRFARAVAVACARARAMAEVTAFKEDPLTWLKAGPGKEMQDGPGWYAHARSLTAGPGDAPASIHSEELRQLLVVLRRALAPYPEALKAVATALRRSSGSRSRRQVPTTRGANADLEMAPEARQQGDELG